MDGFPRFTGLWILTSLTLVIAVFGMVVQLQSGQHTGAVLFAIWVVVMGGGVVSVALLRRRLR
ncbi:MAG TPA: hypothetical protein VGL20_02290 [Candidatus Dormibacteraeota bacterium]|jgi:Mg2+ and Co2+ transporter CorA